jgi:hypothetical protein
LSQELKVFRAYSSLRDARNEAKLLGVRAKKLKEGAKEGEESPRAAADE